ncbi:MAG: site-specific DNA-methyltransferase [PVC group bacterium]|nr:site-specific DNA-methyltransferase [PVC group bacterium]
MNLLNKIHLADCMDIMAQLPDKSVDLAIVDPPYGIGDFNACGKDIVDKRTNKKYLTSQEKYKKITWNKTAPDEKYFNELKRIAKNHIIFGFQHYMNYMWNDLRGVIIHDFKDNSFNMSHADIAITNLQKRISVFRYLWVGFKKEYNNKLDKNRIHPCEKPNDLYRWLLQNYAKEGDLIFDSHSGSGSLAIACIEEGFNYIACEIDADYHKASLERIQPYLDQGKLFEKAG